MKDLAGGSIVKYPLGYLTTDCWKHLEAEMNRRCIAHDGTVALVVDQQCDIACWC